jgi:hypothetical protein
VKNVLWLITEPLISLSIMISFSPMFTLINERVITYNYFEDSILNDPKLVNKLPSFVNDMITWYLAFSHGVIYVVQHDPFFFGLEFL